MLICFATVESRKWGKDKKCRKGEKLMSVPVSPGPSLTHQTPACCLPLPEGSTVLAVLLLQHAVVA